MTFANIVADIINGKHPERVREGRIVTAEGLDEQVAALCEALDARKFIPIGVSGLPAENPKAKPYIVEPLQVTTVEELELGE